MKVLYLFTNLTNGVSGFTIHEYLASLIAKRDKRVDFFWTRNAAPTLRTKMTHFWPTKTHLVIYGKQREWCIFQNFTRNLKRTKSRNLTKLIKDTTKLRAPARLYSNGELKADICAQPLPH